MRYRLYKTSFFITSVRRFLCLFICLLVSRQPRSTTTTTNLLYVYRKAVTLR